MSREELLRQIQSLDPVAHGALREALTRRYQQQCVCENRNPSNGTSSVSTGVDVIPSRFTGENSVWVDVPTETIHQDRDNPTNGCSHDEDALESVPSRENVLAEHRVSEGRQTATLPLLSAPAVPIFHCVSAEELAHLNAEPIIGLDLETTGLDPLTDSIRLVILGSRKATHVIDTRTSPNWADMVGPILSNPGIVKVGHNLKFDVSFLMRAGICVNGVWDTIIASKLIEAGRTRETGYFTLGAVAQRELGVVLDKTLQTSDWSAVQLSAEQIEYAANDAAILLPLHQALSAQLTKYQLSEVMALECRVLPAVAWLEASGAPFDAERWRDLSCAASERRQHIADEISNLAGRSINLASHPQIKHLLAELGVPVPSTAAAVLAQFVDRHPIVPKLLAYREAAKLAGTYGLKYLDQVHPKTGRIHASYHQLGTATGRMSCRDPNLQQVPRDPSYRACFRPKGDRLVIAADLSMVELCVAAELSGDTRMTQAIVEGKDLHRLTASALFRKEPKAVTLPERAFGKAVNFGTIYGQGVEGLIAVAAENGLSLSKTEAQEFKRRFAAAWPQLITWEREQLNGTAPIVRTKSGRLRHLQADTPGTVRLNTPIQGTAADGFKAALARLWETKSECPSAVLVFAVHDEVVVECDTAESEKAATWIKSCLEEGMRQYLRHVPITVETRIAASWGGHA